MISHAIPVVTSDSLKMLISPVSSITAIPVVVDELFPQLKSVKPVIVAVFEISVPEANGQPTNVSIMISQLCIGERVPMSHVMSLNHVKMVALGVDAL